MTTHELQPLSPDRGVDMYCDHRRGNLTDSTLRSHRYRLTRFVEWCDDNGIDNLNDVTGREVHLYRVSRSADVSTPTVKSHMDTLRVFMRFLEDIDAVKDGVAESVQSPKLEKGDRHSTETIAADRMTETLAFLDKFEYATDQHVILRLLWETGARSGALLGIDLDDVHLRDAYIQLRHRPDTGTTLKNKDHSERKLALSSQLVRVLRDHIDEHRYDVTDEHDRNPLLTTAYGRMTHNTFRYRTYQWTRPCEVGEECPHGRDPESCEAMEDRYAASKCPSSKSPHAVRRGAITHWLRQDTPTTVVSDRFDVSGDTLSEHYDARSETQKMEQRRQHMPDFD